MTEVESLVRPPVAHLKSFGKILWDVANEFLRDGCPRMAAALSYYSIFALPGILGLLALAASEFTEPGQLREVISEQVRTFVGVESAAAVINVVEGAVRPELSGPAAALGLLSLAFGATGAFVQLQNALNVSWGVQPDPRRGDVRTFLTKRAVSLLMIVSFGLLLAVSVVAGAGIAFVRGALDAYAPLWTRSWVVPASDVTVSLLGVTVLFSLILRYVPDAEVTWREALAGGLFTAVLFTVGKMLLGGYLSRSDPGNVFGAAGSLAVALIWIYYSSMILLLGAEFTQVWACRHGRDVVPQRGAVRVRQQVVYADGEDAGQEVRPTAPESGGDEANSRA